MIPMSRRPTQLLCTLLPKLTPPVRRRSLSYWYVPWVQLFLEFDASLLVKCAVFVSR